jgi:hypothetical protein
LYRAALIVTYKQLKNLTAGDCNSVDGVQNGVAMAIPLRSKARKPMALRSMNRAGLTLAAALPALAPCRAIHAATYDLVSEFSTTSNSNTSTWSYRFNTTGAHNNNYELMSTAGSLHGTLGALVWPTNVRDTRFTLTGGSYPCWYTPSGPALAPRFCNNGSANNAVDSFRPGRSRIYAARVTPARSMALAPPAQGLAVVSFLVPNNGTATIYFTFMPNDYSCELSGSGIKADGIVWSVDRNSTILSHGVLFSTSPLTMASTGSLNLTTAVTAGERINFTVQPNDGNANCDTTVLTASIVLE